MKPGCQFEWVEPHHARCIRWPECQNEIENYCGELDKLLGQCAGPRGVGDLLAAVARWFGLKRCDGCTQRQKWLNRDWKCLTRLFRKR